jgi:hypothetical protein
MKTTSLRIVWAGVLLSALHLAAAAPTAFISSSPNGRITCDRDQPTSIQLLPPVGEREGRQLR